MFNTMKHMSIILVSIILFNLSTHTNYETFPKTLSSYDHGPISIKLIHEGSSINVNVKYRDNPDSHKFRAYFEEAVNLQFSHYSDMSESSPYGLEGLLFEEMKAVTIAYERIII